MVSCRIFCTADCFEQDESLSLGDKYIAAMWSVFNALEPGTSNTSSEKLFAMIGYLVQVMIDGAVIGVFSSVMMSMGGKERAVHDKLTGARCLAASASLPGRA